MLGVEVGGCRRGEGQLDGWVGPSFGGSSCGCLDARALSCFVAALSVLRAHTCSGKTRLSCPLRCTHQRL